MLRQPKLMIARPTKVEIKQLITVLNKQGLYSPQEFRNMGNCRDNDGDFIISDIVISKDLDNAVLMFKNANGEVIPINASEIIKRSITAIAFNPYDIYDPNWKPADYDDRFVNKLEKIAAPEENSVLEPTRWTTLKSILLNQVYANLKNAKFNRFIQCDLVKQPSQTPNEITINSKNISDYKTIQKAMELSRIIFIAWGNAGTRKRGELMTKLRVAGFDVDQFYEDLLERVNKGELYFYWLSVVGQPVHPNAHGKKEIHQATKDDLDLIFDK